MSGHITLVPLYMWIMKIGPALLVEILREGRGDPGILAYILGILVGHQEEKGAVAEQVENSFMQSG